jgi:hypothetical protein
MDQLQGGGIRIGSDGRILHLLYSNSIKGIIFRCRYAVTRARNGNKPKNKEIGYHLYNLLPLARLKARFSDRPLFDSTAVKHALEFCKSHDFITQLQSNLYSYPYNTPGFEAPAVLEGFGLPQNSIPVFSSQLDLTFHKSYDNRGFTRNTSDPLTLNSRVYEYFLLSN